MEQTELALDIEQPDEDERKCEGCGETSDELEVVIVDGNSEWLCESCRDELHSCDRCNAVSREDDLTNVYSDDRRRDMEAWCSRCYENHTWRCDDCSERFADDVWNTSCGDSTLCESCYNDNYFTCEGCNETYHNDDYGDEGYCQSCNDDRSPRFIRECSTRAQNELSWLPARDRSKKLQYLGVELECQTSRDLESIAERTLELLGSDFVILKEDVSIGSSGFEIVTAPATYENQAARWKPFFDSLPRNLSSWKSGECGLHVHVSRNSVSQLTIGKLLVFLNDTGNKTLVSTIAGRYANHYCKVLAKKVSDGNGNSACDRYEALNLTNGGTIEFRIFRGTLDRERFYADLQFVVSSIAFCKQAGISEISASKYLAWLKPQAKDYPELTSYLVKKGLLAAPKPKPATIESTATKATASHDEV